MRIIYSFPDWQLSGVSTWAVELYSQLKRIGCEQTFLFTSHYKTRREKTYPDGICFEDLGKTYITRFKEEQWVKSINYINSQAPCIYLPNFDFDNSTIFGKLSDKVAIIPILHSDESCYYNLLKRQMKNVDSAVAVSKKIMYNCLSENLINPERIKHIPYGINIPEIKRDWKVTNKPLQLLYANRLSQYQKRVYDLPLIIRELALHTENFELHLIGDGPDKDKLLNTFSENGLAQFIHYHGRLSRDAVLQRMLQSDVYLLCSDFEGLPLGLLESMGLGMVPICYEIDSGINQVVVDKVNGFIIPHSNVKSFASCLAKLESSRNRLVDMGMAAEETIRLAYTARIMGASYSEWMQKAMDRARGAIASKGSRKLIPPEELTYINRFRRLKNGIRRKVFS